MNFFPMTRGMISNRFRSTLLIPVLLFVAGAGSVLANSITLEGQNKGDTNTWSTSNLQNWQELDFIPCRVHFGVNTLGNDKTITVFFDSLNGTTPGFQDLYSFSSSSNVVFTAAPKLSAPTSASTWS